MSQTLFLKDSVLFISIDGKEYEVSNPEELTSTHIRHMPDGDWRIKTPGSGWTGEEVNWPVEWPYGVELHEIPDGGRDMSGPPYPIVDFKTVARLLPKEKKEPESDYKQFEAMVDNVTYDQVRSEYLNDKGRIWTKEEETLMWICKHFTLTRLTP